MTAANMNAISALLNGLKGASGVIELEDSVIIENGPDGDRYFRLCRGTTGQRHSSPSPGDTRYNNTTGEPEFWNGAEWENWINGTGIVTYGNLNANGGVGTGSNQVAVGNHTH